MNRRVTAGVKRFRRADGSVNYSIFIKREEVIALLASQGHYDEICLSFDAEYEEGVEPMMSEEEDRDDAWAEAEAKRTAKAIEGLFAEYRKYYHSEPDGLGFAEIQEKVRQARVKAIGRPYTERVRLGLE